MNKKNNTDTPFVHYKDIKHKCSICNIVSIEVDMSSKYKQYLCIDCLKEKIIEG